MMAKIGRLNYLTAIVTFNTKRINKLRNASRPFGYIGRKTAFLYIGNFPRHPH